MLKRVLPWSLVLTVVLVIVQIGVERGPWDAGVSLWRWRYLLGSIILACFFAAGWAWSYDRGYAKGAASVPTPEDNPRKEEIIEARAVANHQWTSIEQLQYLVRTIATHVMQSGHVNAERAAKDLRTLGRQHRVWYDEGAHATRDQFIGVVNGILEVRKRNGRMGIFADLNAGEAEAWERRLVSVRGNLHDMLEDRKEGR